jgi:hypothetical protein
MRVQVQKVYSKPHLVGQVGTIQHLYGGEDPAAFEVLFPDGQTELFWYHELKEADFRENSFSDSR